MVWEDGSREAPSYPMIDAKSNESALLADNPETVEVK